MQAGLSEPQCLNFRLRSTNLSGQITIGHILSNYFGERNGCESLYKNSKGHCAEAGGIFDIFILSTN